MNCCVRSRHVLSRSLLRTRMVKKAPLRLGLHILPGSLSPWAHLPCNKNPRATPRVIPLWSHQSLWRLLIIDGLELTSRGIWGSSQCRGGPGRCPFLFCPTPCPVMGKNDAASGEWAEPALIMLNKPRLSKPERGKPLCVETVNISSATAYHPPQHSQLEGLRRKLFISASTCFLKNF